MLHGQHCGIMSFSVKSVLLPYLVKLFVPDKIKLDIDHTERIEAVAKDQSDSELWHAMRNGRFTNS